MVVRDYPIAESMMDGRHVFLFFFFSRVAHDIQMRYIDIFSMKKLSFTGI